MDHKPPAKPSDPSSADTAQESPTFIEDDAMTPLPPYVTTATSREWWDSGATMTTTERLARLEAAQELFVMMIGIRAKMLHEERQKPVPDEAKIAHWLADQDRFVDEEDALTLDDMAGVERALQHYGPIVRGA